MLLANQPWGATKVRYAFMSHALIRTPVLTNEDNMLGTKPVGIPLEQSGALIVPSATELGRPRLAPMLGPFLSAAAWPIKPPGMPTHG
jgi:hypothetical protein